MSTLGRIILKKGRERSVRSRHPWIFSGAIAHHGAGRDGAGRDGAGEDGIEEPGAFARVYDSSENLLGAAYFNPHASIAARMVCFDDRDPREAMRSNFERAQSLRSALLPREITGYRLVNGEGDEMPGLIIDCYGDVAVVQSGTAGIDRLLPEIVEWIHERLSPRCIYERSLLPSRKEEGLESRQGALHGELPDDISFMEYGCSFYADIVGGQKTGFFLDQREMRALVGSLAPDLTVLNCFAYTGGFSVHALRGGARFVTSVDLSAQALALAEKNVERNGFAPDRHRTVRSDVFDFLRADTESYDLVIVDPPAFAKSRSHIESAVKGYREINIHALKRVSPGGLLVTSSCSHFLSREIFARTLFEAAREVGRAVRVLSLHRHAFDHPVSLFHPEGDYLKSLVLQVE